MHHRYNIQQHAFVLLKGLHKPFRENHQKMIDLPSKLVVAFGNLPVVEVLNTKSLVKLGQQTAFLNISKQSVNKICRQGINQKYQNPRSILDSHNFLTRRPLLVKPILQNIVKKLEGFFKG